MHHTKASIKPTKERAATFIASNDREDSMGDIIDPKGWELSDFKNNPVVLFAHNTRALPVGKVSAIKVRDNKLMANVDFLPEGIDEFADKVARMVKEGFLNAVSVGFRALDMEPRFDKNGNFIGYKFNKQSLSELSIVPVPANADALALAKELNYTDDDTKRLLLKPEQTKNISANRMRLNIARARAITK